MSENLVEIDGHLLTHRSAEGTKRFRCLIDLREVAAITCGSDLSTHAVTMHTRGGDRVVFQVDQRDTQDFILKSWKDVTHANRAPAVLARGPDPAS